MSPESILDTVPVYNSVKADAWDAFHDSTDPEDFKSRFDPLPLPHSAKADLWDMKFGASTTDEQPEVPITPVAPEPEPPARVDRPSSQTPNAPTAATATTPEAPDTLALQLPQLQAGQRKAVMFPKGQGQPRALPPGLRIANDGMGNTYAYRPDLTSRGAISSAAKGNKLPEILGGPMGMGAPDKSALQGEPIAVTGRTAEGVEAQSTATDIPNLHTAIAATRAVTPAGGTVSVGPVAETISRRAVDMAKRTPYFRRMDPDQQAAELKKVQAIAMRRARPTLASPGEIK